MRTSWYSKLTFIPYHDTWIFIEGHFVFENIYFQPSKALIYFIIGILVQGGTVVSNWFVLYMLFSSLLQLGRTSIIVEASNYIKELKEKVDHLNQVTTLASSSSDQSLPMVYVFISHDIYSISFYVVMYHFSCSMSLMFGTFWSLGAGHCWSLGQELPNQCVSKEELTRCAGIHIRSIWRIGTQSDRS